MFFRVSYPNSLVDENRAVSQLFSDFLHPAIERSASVPPVDVAEYKDNYEVVVELPGMKKSDVKISVENGILTLSGERKHYGFPDGTTVLHHETDTRPFSRSFELPGEVNADVISAELQDGVLRIRLPKTERARAREVQIL